MITKVIKFSNYQGVFLAGLLQESS